MADIVERYIQSLRRLWDFHRVFEAPFRPWRAPTIGEYAHAEAEGARHLAVRRAVADALLDDRIATVCRAIRESVLGERLFIVLAPPDHPMGEDLRNFLRRRLIVRDDTDGWGPNGAHPVFAARRTLYRNPVYVEAYDLASRELRTRRNRLFNRTPIERAGNALYEAMETVLIDMCLAEIGGQQLLGRRFPGYRAVLPRGIADDGRFLRGGGEVLDGFMERGVFSILEEPQFAVRAGRDGSFFDLLFRSEREALEYARNRATAGRAVIRRDSGLPLVWSDGAPGNAVDAFYIYRIPEGTMVIEGAAARVRGLSGVVYPGGGPQVAVARRPGQVFTLVGEAVPITRP